MHVHRRERRRRLGERNARWNQRLCSERGLLMFHPHALILFSQRTLVLFEHKSVPALGLFAKRPLGRLMHSRLV